MLEAVAPICAAASVPVTADMEAGYGVTAEEMDRTAGGILEAGAVGLNLEDGTGRADSPLLDPAAHAAKIRAVVEGGRRRGVHLVVNARIDVISTGSVLNPAKSGGNGRRGVAYRNAGATCIFVPGVTDPSVSVRSSGSAARSMSSRRRGPAVPARKRRRAVSLGSGPMRAAMT